MKIFTKTTAAAIVGMIFAAGHALANPVCEPPGTFYTAGNGTYYDHGCHAFALHDLSENQARQLWNAGHCSMWGNASGGEIEEVEVLAVDYEVADGSRHSRDNLTSMGAAASNGSQVMRVRSATDGNPVSIRQAGGGVVWSGTVNRGDTLVQVGAPGTYIATTGSRTITKATGPQTFGDTRTVEIVTFDEPEVYDADILLCDEPQIIRQ